MKKVLAMLFVGAMIIVTVFFIAFIIYHDGIIALIPMIIGLALVMLFVICWDYLRNDA